MKDIKYHLDPYNEEDATGIQGNIRRIWRLAELSGNGEIKSLAIVVFDQACRMSASLKKYRKRIQTLPREVQEDLDKIC